VGYVDDNFLEIPSEELDASKKCANDAVCASRHRSGVVIKSYLYQSEARHRNEYQYDRHWA